MPKLSRVFQNLFMRDGSSSHSEQFGSKAAGSPLPTLDPNSIQSLAAFINNGWLDAIVGANKQPFLEDMNGLFRLIFYQICNLFQDGIPAWDSGTTYYSGSIVRKDGTFELYGSLVDNNTGNALPNKTANGFWTYLNPPSVQSGIVSAYAGASAPFGYLLCDGTDYVQATYPDLYAAVGSTWNTYRGQAAPAAGRFRVPALQGLTLIGVGSGLGLTARTLAAFVGEENHTLVTGEMPVHAHTVTGPDGTVSTVVGWHGISPGGANGIGIFGIGGLNAVGTSGGAIPDTVDTAGGGTAHNNMQPSGALNYVIKV
jgi:microcystin-dependent protein